MYSGIFHTLHNLLDEQHQAKFDDNSHVRNLQRKQILSMIQSEQATSVTVQYGPTTSAPALGQAAAGLHPQKR